MRKKYFIFILILVGLTLFAVSYFINKNIDNNQKNTSNKSQDAIIIKTEPFLEKDISARLEQINKDSAVPIKVDNNSQSCDAAIFVDKNPCEEIPNKSQNDISKSDIYSKPIILDPQSFKDNLGNNFANLGLKIQMSAKNNDQIYTAIKDTLTKSFSQNPPQTTHTTFVGDVMLGRWVNYRMDQYGYDYPFSQTLDLFKNSDLNVANLESPFAETEPYNQLGLVFRANPKGIETLKYAGINLVNLANNHFGNAGNAGMDYTFNLLTQNNIGYFGAGNNSNDSHQPKIMDMNGIKFAFLGYADASITPESYASKNDSPGLNLDNVEKMKEDVTNAKTQADFVIISMHLGTEYVNIPNQNQINFAHLAIDAGADFIYGHHPHVVESIEVYNSKPIFYSLGNFVMDQDMGETEHCLAIKVEFMYNKIVGIKLIPTIIINYAQAQIADSQNKEEILDTIYLNSK